MTAAFDDEQATFSVLVNAEGQHSLWPSTVSTPEGWTVVRPPGDRESALAYVSAHWKDLRPRSLAHRLRTREESTTGSQAAKTTPADQLFSGMVLDHVTFYVADLTETAEWLTDGYGLTVTARSGGGGRPSRARSVLLNRRDIRILLSEPLPGTSPGAEYVDRHGDGVADIALRVDDASAAFAEAVRRGAEPLVGPTVQDDLVTATIAGVGDITHTFVQRAEGCDDRLLPGLEFLDDGPEGEDCGLGEVDHFAICVEPDQMEQTVDFYSRVLDFERIFTERIEVDDQVMITEVVQSCSGSVTFTLITPDQSRATGHLDEFLKSHNGPGVQHIAFTSDDILESVNRLTARGIEFLPTPAAYYRMLPERVRPLRHSVPELERLNILIDEDHDGQLFQIFTRSVHPKGTLFLEIIERLGARSFGSGNIKALYQAVEHEQGRGTGRAS